MEDEVQDKLCEVPSEEPCSVLCSAGQVWDSLLLLARSRLELSLARLLDEAVQVDVGCLLGQVKGLQPCVVENVFQGWSVGSVQG